MGVCHCTALAVALSVFLLVNSSTTIDKNDNGLLDKLYKHNTVKGTLETVPANGETSVTSHQRRPRDILGEDEFKEITDSLQVLSKSVRGIQGEYDLLERALSKQRTSIAEMDQNLVAVQSDIHEIQGNILLVTGTLGRLITQVQTVENDTKKLESAVSNINVLVHQLLKSEKERTVQISKLESATKQLTSAISPESLRKTIQELIPAVVTSSTSDLRQQISELKFALEKEKVTEMLKPAPLIDVNALQEALQQISELKQKCVSKDELEQRLQNVVNVREVRDNTKIVNKCSVNVHHEPRDGRTHLRLVMDPPNTESANCK